MPSITLDGLMPPEGVPILCAAFTGKPETGSAFPLLIQGDPGRLAGDTMPHAPPPALCSATPSWRTVLFPWTIAPA